MARVVAWTMIATFAAAESFAPRARRTSPDEDRLAGVPVGGQHLAGRGAPRPRVEEADVGEGPSDVRACDEGPCRELAPLLRAGFAGRLIPRRGRLSEAGIEVIARGRPPRERAREGGTDPFDSRPLSASVERRPNAMRTCPSPPAPNAEPGSTATCASSRQKSANSRSSMPVPATSGKQKSPASGTGQRMPGIASRPRATRVAPLAQARTGSRTGSRSRPPPARRAPPSPPAGPPRWRRSRGAGAP